MAEYQKTVVIDFDGVIAQYDKWRGVDVFGAPMKYAKEAIAELREWGWWVVIYTTRKKTPALLSYLNRHGIRYNAVNSCDHNPPDTSNKPIAEVYIDDRGWWDVKRKFSWVRVMRRLRRLYQPLSARDLTNSSKWSSRWTRFWGWCRQQELAHPAMWT